MIMINIRKIITAAIFIISLFVLNILLVSAFIPAKIFLVDYYNEVFGNNVKSEKTIYELDKTIPFNEGNISSLVVMENKYGHSTAFILYTDYTQAPKNIKAESTANTNEISVFKENISMGSLINDTTGTYYFCKDFKCGSAFKLSDKKTNETVDVYLKERSYCPALSTQTDKGITLYAEQLSSGSKYIGYYISVNDEYFVEYESNNALPQIFAHIKYMTVYDSKGNKYLANAVKSNNHNGAEKYIMILYLNKVPAADIVNFYAEEIYINNTLVAGIWTWTKY